MTQENITKTTRQVELIDKINVIAKEIKVAFIALQESVSLKGGFYSSRSMAIKNRIKRLEMELVDHVLLAIKKDLDLMCVINSIANNIKDAYKEEPPYEDLNEFDD